MGPLGSLAHSTRLPARAGTIDDATGERLKLLLVGETTLGEALGQLLFSSTFVFRGFVQLLTLC